MYSMNCLEWHPGDERQDRTPQLSVVGLDKVASEAFACRSIVLLLLSPRALTHQRQLRGFAFGRPDAVRRWSGSGYPVTRASQSRGGGRILRAGWLKKSEVVRCDDMAPKSKSQHRANCIWLR